MKHLLLLILFTASLVSATGLDILPVKPLNPEAFSSDLLKTSDRLLPAAFEKDKRFTVRKAVADILRELQMSQAGLTTESPSPALAGADIFLISSLWEKDGEVIFQMRAMSAEDCSLIQSASFSCKKNAFEKKMEQSVKTMAESLAGERTQKDSGPSGAGGQTRITVLRLEEDGPAGLAPAAAGLFMNGLLNTGDFSVIEREEARWAVQEREIEMMGFVDRSSVKAAAKIQSLELGVEGFVVSKNKGIM